MMTKVNNKDKLRSTRREEEREKAEKEKEIKKR